MESKPTTASFSGVNFQGNIQLGKDTLKITISEYSKKLFFYSDIRRDMMQRGSAKFKFFQTLQSLFEQLRTNKKLEINDENKLSILIEVPYKNEIKNISIDEIPLLQNDKENDKMQNFGQTIERLAKKIKMQEELLPKLLIFKGDQSNSKYFQFNGKKLQKNYKDIFSHSIYANSCSIPKNGAFYFQVKIKSTANHTIGTGIIQKQIKQKFINSRSQNIFGKQCICLFLNNGQLYCQKQVPQIIALPKIEVGSIIKTVIDMNYQVIAWFINGKFTRKLHLRKELLQKQLFPFVSMYKYGDIIQFVDQ